MGKKPSEHLEVHHIIALRDFDFSTKRQPYENSRDRDLFLLLVYTGLYYSDLKDLQKSDVKLDPEYGPYIWAGRFKNDNLSIIPLWNFSHAIELFDKYKSENPKDRYVIDRKYLIEDQAFNRNLKVIAKHLEWDFNLYNKMGRTTNAQLYIRFGANRPTVSKMLGHEKESTTETYFTINLADVIEGTKGVDFKKIGL